MSQIVTVKDLAEISLTCPPSTSIVLSVMNTQYNHIYVNDKAEPNVSKITEQDLGAATEGLEIIEDDDFVTVWDGKFYQVFAIKA